MCNNFFKPIVHPCEKETALKHVHKTQVADATSWKTNTKQLKNSDGSAFPTCAFLNEENEDRK